MGSVINESLTETLSFDQDAFKVTSYADDYILRGNGFSVEYTFSVGSGVTAYDVAFDTSGFTRTGLVAYPTMWNMSKGHSIVTLGTCTSYSAGTALTPANRNSAFQASYPSQTVFKYNVSTTGFSAADTQLLVGTEAGAIATGGGTNEGRFPQWLTPGLIYIFRVNNQAGDDITLGTRIYWFEY